MRILRSGAEPSDPQGVRREAVHDPRLSDSQRDHIRKLVQFDEDAEVAGIDYKMRPVVSALLGTPRRRRRYALLRNGEPTRVTHPMQETWE